MSQPNPFAAEMPRQLSPVSDTEEVVDQPADVAWPHDTIQFLGDTLEVRKPTAQALAAYSLASSKYVSASMRNDMTGLFIARHLSPDSYAQVFSRLMDPDDPDYTLDTIGELMRDIVGLQSSGSA